MSEGLTFRVTILWEHELRDAAMALKACADLPDEATKEQRGDAMGTALSACWTALYHLTEKPDAPLTVMAAAGTMKDRMRKAVGGRPSGGAS